jgi:hypothetical protein
VDRPIKNGFMMLRKDPTVIGIVLLALLLVVVRENVLLVIITGLICNFIPFKWDEGATRYMIRYP